jgi:transcriptional regulator with AAA-type ATPase domain/tetratricopeptide (TPR) repeat protein
MIRASEGASSIPWVERFSVSATRERWAEFLGLEHGALPSLVDFSREGDDWIVRRTPIAGRRIAAGRIPSEQAPALFLQAAGLCAFLQASGFWLDEDDLAGAVHNRAEGIARLFLVRTPACISRGGPGPAPSAVLAAFLHRLFARGRRIGSPAARSLFDRLIASDAAFRRAEFWLASAFRAFPQLAVAAAAPARVRTIGLTGDFWRDTTRRARLEAASEQLAGRAVRLFACEGSRFTPGGALGLGQLKGGAVEASRELRERHVREKSRLPAIWIAVEPGRWDDLSRRAFEAAVHALGDEVEQRVIKGGTTAPRLPDEWRREVFVPCGTLSASLRFYEGLAELARPDPVGGLDLARRAAASERWASFVSDPTGSAPLPLPSTAAAGASVLLAEIPAPEREVLEALAAHELPMEVQTLARMLPRRRLSGVLSRIESRGEATRDVAGVWRIAEPGRRKVALSQSRRREICRRRASVEEHPGRRVELLLEAGEAEEAFREAERWFRASGGLPAEQWFGLSSRLSNTDVAEKPVWLMLLEAERELAGGRAEEAQRRLVSVAESAAASPEERRVAMLRAAEVQAHRGQSAQAGRLAAAWRRSFPDAPANERVRALRAEAGSRAREGDHATAFRLLDEAEREGAGESFDSRLATALARADVYSVAGRFHEEKEIYERWRPAVFERQDDISTARLLAREALGLSDRRDFAPAVARLEQALAVTRDDAALRAELLVDLAATLYHAGRPGPCVSLLEEAIGLACAVGREDLLRVARGNRIELWINQCRWEEASREIEALLRAAAKEGDPVRQLVALHHRSRLALRRGFLEEAGRDNAEARSIASRVEDRLEVGELWLEDGDRFLYAGDFVGAKHAYEVASADPPDRCDSDVRARQRLQELAWPESGPPQEVLEDLKEEFARDEYASAERVARWHRLRRGRCGTDEPLCQRAERILRARGGARLADCVFGRRSETSADADTAASLRDLRAAAAALLAGHEADASLSPLGLTGLAVEDADGREILRLGNRLANGSESERRSLDAGAIRYELLFWPAPAAETATAITFLLETLLFRVAPPDPPIEFAEGWRRLGVVAADAAMEEPYRRLLRFAPQPVTVLILGESGSGKEAVARAVHSLSTRAVGSFVAVNVPAIPPALLESELFGHSRGAFTGADRDRRGLLEEASGGTIFFDEIGDLTPTLQVKLLRALQEREIRRVGENRPRAIDVRVVSATSRQLARDVESGAFREDLYYRLHVALIALPALRDRGRDAILLARHFLARFGREYGRGSLQYSPEAVSALAAHSWPGNVRELQNAVAQAAALAESNGVVGVELLPEAIRRPRRTAVGVEDYRTRMDAHRRGLITEALERSGGNRSRAARELGLSRQALLYLIRELNVASRPRSDH